MHLLKFSDLAKNDVDALIERAIHLKGRRQSRIPHQPLRGMTLGMIFDKASTRTRVSFEAAMQQLGGSAIFLSSKDSQIGRGEPIKDTARVMSRYVAAVVIRTFAHSIIEEFAKFSTVPVINGLTDDHHPCQVLADLMTIVEKKGGYAGLSVCWIGDGNNMANTWIEAASILGFTLKLACPKGYLPDAKLMKTAVAQNPAITLVKTTEEAAKGADVLNTDVWASMGQEKEAAKRKKAFAKYQINEKLMKLAKKDAIVLHCLPAHRGEEISEVVLEGANSVVWDQAENRLHVQKAVLERLLSVK